MNVDGRRFVRCLPLILTPDLDSSHAPEVVTGILAGPVDQQVFLFIHEVFPVKFPHLEIGRKLDRVGRAGLFAETTEDATGEVDAEELRITPAGLVFGCLERDAIDRTCNRTEVARHTAFASVGITRQYDPAPVARREIWLLLGILDGDPLLEGVEKNVPDRSQYAEHLSPPDEHCRAGYEQIRQGQG